jgi:hypothetical protein
MGVGRKDVLAMTPCPASWLSLVPIAGPVGLWLFSSFGFVATAGSGNVAPGRFTGRGVATSRIAVTF